ncbi:pyruvate dehydrogenase complex dihydrolipoamide acetyltransferase [Corallococcus exercitus]|uniref:Acetyltransferase component of pyruvate dehydrogenase complex n=2 Tax=Corallococcus exercitus TaxID=2316736 RepID=A0A7Y4KEW6_9BACT|nr:pyruvate dehydrogenase complex dihydrolipoamide acetyltransferase [Corallococcus exercitus]NOK32578.1 pyruvate dehydrogenase complex dihydrolipoamide acetyltransferase [Corallococcus exercitus]
MATPIQMPSLSPTMKEGKIVKWLKKVGDKISSGDAIAEVETDKSNLEVEAFDDGYLIQIAVPEGEVATVGSPIGYLGAKGEKATGSAPSAPAPQKTEAPKAAAPAAAPKPPEQAPAPAASGAGEGIAILMPSLSPTMTEGKIVKWLKKEGDKVSSGDAIAEVETDKSNLEVEAYDDGTLARITVQAGDMAKVGAPIAFLTPKGAKAGASAPAAAPQAPAAPKAPAAAAPSAPAGGQVVPLRREPQAPTAGGGGAGGRLRASPLAKRMAQERGLDISQVRGTGPLGRVVKRDVEQALGQGLAKAPAAQAPAAKKAGAQPEVRAFGTRPEPQAVPMSSMRKVIGQRMSEVKPGVPHFYLTVEVEMDAAVKIREEAKALDLKVSVNDIIVKAAAIALRRSPKMNVSLQGDQVLHYGTVDVGIAVAIEDGLITPIIRDADLKGLQAISAESRDMAERARERSLKPAEYTGGSLTVSNLGMYGIDQFIAVINPPQSAIIAVGAVAEKAVVRDGQLAVRKMMTVTLSGDHRVIDGATGAEYLRELKGLLEHPSRLLF